MSQIQLVEGFRNPSHTRIPFIITGFGFLKSLSDDPWFKYRDLYNAVPDGPYKRLIVPSKAGYSAALSQLEERKLMINNGREVSHLGTIYSPRIVAITDLGREAMLNTAVYSVTNHGLDLPGILHIPDVVSAVLNESDFKERVIAAVSGIDPGGNTTP